MLLVYPVSQFDLPLAKETAAWVAELGGVKSYPVLMVIDPEVAREDWIEIRDILTPAALSVTTVKALLDTEQDAGWPAGPNAMFRSAVAATCGMFPGEPWYFFEPDNTPLAPDWLDRLTEAYTACGKPFMGVLQQSWKLLEPHGERIPAGHHLVGTAIYPTDVREYTRTYLHCRDSASGRVCAFDVAMQYDLVDCGHAVHTDLIQHNWLTQNYRLEADGVIRCDAKEGRLDGQLGFSLPAPVDESVAVVHGCKDLSLLRLLRARRNTATAVAEAAPAPSLPDTLAAAFPSETPPEQPPAAPTKPARTRKKRMKVRKTALAALLMCVVGLTGLTGCAHKQPGPDTLVIAASAGRTGAAVSRAAESNQKAKQASESISKQAESAEKHITKLKVTQPALRSNADFLALEQEVTGLEATNQMLRGFILDTDVQHHAALAELKGLQDTLPVLQAQIDDQHSKLVAAEQKRRALQADLHDERLHKWRWCLLFWSLLAVVIALFYFKSVLKTSMPWLFFWL